MEKSQDQISFENLHSRHLTGFWKEYELPSLGNVIHWIYVYCNLDIAEMVTVGDGVIMLYGESFLEYEHRDGIPYFFNLVNPKYDFILANQKYYLDGLIKYPEYVEKMKKMYESLN
jgi:hypothetical protein